MMRDCLWSGNIHKGEVFRVREKNKSRDEEQSKMKKEKTYLRLTTPSCLSYLESSYLLLWAVKGVLREPFTGKMLSEIGYKALEDFRDSRKETPTQYGGPRSERTVNLEMGILRHMFRKGVKWGRIEKNPFENCEDLFYKGRNKSHSGISRDRLRRP